MAAIGWIFVLLLTFGHGAVHVYAFNRINATGLRRTTIKRIEKGILASFVFWPILLVVLDASSLASLLRSGLNVELLSWPTKIYPIFAIGGLICLLPGWIAGRLAYWSQRQHTHNIQSRLIDTTTLGRERPFNPRWLKTLSRFPGNEIHWIEINTKKLRIPDLPYAWNGLTIAHLSDLHLTGWYHDRYYEAALQAIAALQPDLYVLSGDLVDRENCIGGLEKLLGPLQAPLGKFFVLGNHDKRIDQPDLIRNQMHELGWIDLGKSSYESMCPKRSRCLQMIGNEQPWFNYPDRNISERDLLSKKPDNLLLIGVSHGPDQWNWAIESQCQLMLSGHTHGGQVRLPLIGPIISPSWFGSKFASGIFQRQGCVMHVSRGLAGTQPLRINCKPEASLLVLQSRQPTAS